MHTKAFCPPHPLLLPLLSLSWHTSRFGCQFYGIFVTESFMKFWDAHNAHIASSVHTKITLGTQHFPLWWHWDIFFDLLIYMSLSGDKAERRLSLLSQLCLKHSSYPLESLFFYSYFAQRNNRCTQCMHICFCNSYCQLFSSLVALTLQKFFSLFF